VGDVDDIDLTRLATVTTPVGVGPDSSASWSRFAPGAMFAGRFRIVAPLGRGGMGEVYRADDLRLEQPVALKLLPESVAGDAARLAQFHNEVRVARTIAHRNVCRTYDIGDADGRHFLTMEYVDGEDLASLLRRIGRFPQDKAIEVARQICAGLAAAHERGVLHRDLKPANIMIDGEGHVRITDFGLAAVVGSVGDIRAGTPAYMAPEQLAGRAVTARSDIYSLGLVLFELFTGRRVFEANTLNDLIKLHESHAVASPSSVVRDLDPTIERAILRCLDEDPARRPASALAVAAVLPGGDQLAAAIAAGETPSPEMVAAAGEQSALRPAIGLGLVAFTILMLAALTLLSQRYSLVHRIPMPKSIDSLTDRAQEMLERVGYSDPPYDTARGWAFDREYLNYAGSSRSILEVSHVLASGRTAALVFWYRTSPTRIFPITTSLLPSQADPPFTLSGMRLVRFDSLGRLIEFHSMTPQIDDAASGETVNWSALFDAAGLSMTAFRAVAPRWAARSQADVRAAWEGRSPDVPDANVRVEAAGYHGKPIFFTVIFPWTQPQRVARPAEASVDRVVAALATVVGGLILLAAAFLARRHLRTGRGDRRGALRTAAVMFGCQAVGWLVYARHYGDVQIEMGMLNLSLAFTLFYASIVWLFYLALEPYVRRLWPELLIGWTRLLSGHLRDPLVGRDVLVGMAAGTIGALLIAGPEIVSHALGQVGPTPYLPGAALLLGARYSLSIVLDVVRSAMTDALQCTCIVVFFKIIVRRTWLVMLLSTVAILPIAMSGTFTGERLALDLTMSILGITLVFGVLLRFGLLALIVTFYTFLTLRQFPLTTDFSRPYAGACAVVLLAMAGISIFGFYASRGNEPLFGRALLDPS
jgi:serine/threonine protein kinase